MSKEIKITFISDLHNKFKQIDLLEEGDIIICSGDFTSMGYIYEVKEFLKWFSKLPYTYKIFIAGNHDISFEDDKYFILDMIREYDVIYLEDSFVEVEIFEDLIDSIISIDKIKIYGSPWQPEFYNWAFNLPRNGWELEQKWNDIPDDTDILITHGPPFGILDTVRNIPGNLGCELLSKRIDVIKPKISVFGHIHDSYGYLFKNKTHFINASVLNEQYKYTNLPISILWNKENNKLNFIA